MLRVSPQLHRQAYTRARQEGKSLNQWISEKLEQAG
jgi:predicted HicB family RNase H-like nuclease